MHTRLQFKYGRMWYLGEAAGAHGAGMQGKADLLQHVRMGSHPAQAHARGQKLAETVQAHHPPIHIQGQICLS